MRRIHFETIDSTSTFAKEYLKAEGKDLSEPLLITADMQTAGRGRTGKTFASLGGNSIYMTLVLPVNRRPEECLFMTVATAVAVCETLMKEGCDEARIKWVNDLYLGSRKICGILTEAVTDVDTGQMRHAVIGVGINIDADSKRIPAELKEKAGSISGLSCGKEELTKEIASGIRQLVMEALSSEKVREQILGRYKELSMILGREVFWEENGETVTGIARDIDKDANLIVETKRGVRKLDSGYISVKF